jgi:hypothetical protein
MGFFLNSVNATSTCRIHHFTNITVVYLAAVATSKCSQELLCADAASQDSATAAPSAAV